MVKGQSEVFIYRTERILKMKLFFDFLMPRVRKRAEPEEIIDMSSFSEGEVEKKKPKRVFKRKTKSTTDFFDMTNDKKKEDIDFNSFAITEDEDIEVIINSEISNSSPSTRQKPIQVESEEELELSDLNDEEMIKLQQIQQKALTPTKSEASSKSTDQSVIIYLVHNLTKETYVYKTTPILHKDIQKKYEEEYYLKLNNEIITTQPILPHSTVEIILVSQIQDIKIIINSNLLLLHHKTVYVQKNDKVSFLLNLLCHLYKLNKNDLIVKFNGTKLYSNVLIQTLCKDVITLDIQTELETVEKKVEQSENLFENINDGIVIKIAVLDRPKLSIRLRNGEKLDEFLKQVELKLGLKSKLFFDGDELTQSILDDEIEKGDCLDAKIIY